MSETNSKKIGTVTSPLIESVVTEAVSFIQSLVARDLTAWERAQQVKQDFEKEIVPTTQVPMEIYVERDKDGVYISAVRRYWHAGSQEFNKNAYEPKCPIPETYKGVPVKLGVRECFQRWVP